MSRIDSDHFDDADDLLSDAPRKAKVGFRSLWLVLLIAAPVAIVVLVGGGFLLFAMRTSNAIREQTTRDRVDVHQAAEAKRIAEQAVREAAEAKRPLPLRELKAMVGATREDIIAAIGEPDVRYFEPNREIWTYRQRVNKDGDSPAVKIVFVGGVVVEVNF